MQARAGLDPAALRRIARKLHAGYAKETTDCAPRWSDIGDEKRKLWMRLAARAATATIRELTAMDVDPSFDEGAP